MVYKIPYDCYPRVLEKLTVFGKFSTVHIAGCLNHAISGSITANFFTDSWPDFSIIVCQVSSPHISGSWDLLCYAASVELLWEVLEQEKLIKEGEGQIIIVSKASVGIDLSKMLSLQLKISASFELYDILCLPDEPTSSLLNFECPDGYTIEELKPEHAELIAHYWTFFTGLPNRISMLEECIKKFSSAAVFADENKSQPVSWAIQYHFAEVGVLYTMESHQRKGLASAALAALCQSIQQKSPSTPFVSVLEGSHGRGVAERLGFVSDGVEFCFLETDGNTVN